MNQQIEKLQKEREDNEAKLQRYERKKEQLDHQLSRAESRQQFLSKKERDRRTHHLCNIGGTIEHFFPISKAMTRDQFYELMEQLSELPEVQQLMNSAHSAPGGEPLSHSTTSM